MFDLFPEIEIGPAQAAAIARGLVTVARADGHMHEQEGALISEFYASLSDSPADLAALQKADPVDGEFMAASLATGDQRRLFLKTAILLAFADGNYTGAESKLIGEYATAFGVEADELARLEQQVKEYMLSQLTGITNSESVAEVAKELKV